MKIVIALVGAALGVGLGFALIANDTEPTRDRNTVEVQITGLDCPEEDTCTPDLDYRDGKWYGQLSRP